ncbi:DUF5522 domain-containing protein [Rufibacter glacialis]|nr:DUF5522 domain-containing protein [Rufibacter glacialis]
MVFTEQYHRRRGYCCQSGCKHCPYGFLKKGQIGSADGSKRDGEPG